MNIVSTDAIGTYTAGLDAPCKIITHLPLYGKLTIWKLLTDRLKKTPYFRHVPALTLPN